MTESELIFSSVLNLDRTQVYLGDYHITQEQADRLADIFLKRAGGGPLQYILGKAEFFGLEFEVNNHVLIPRPETEILVDTAIGIISGNSLSRIMDIGTGSGCIAISIAKNVKDTLIDATDISIPALEVAEANASRQDVSARVRFLNADIFPETGRYDLIVSNPPYIRSYEISSLPREVRHEPRIALDGGSDGLDFYKSICRNLSAYLEAGGFLIMEIGLGQVEDVKDILDSCGLFDSVEFVRDYSGIERVVVARRWKN